MLEVACAPCVPPGLLLPQPGDLTQRMRSVNNSVNNWLAFSLSPHLTIDAADPSGGGGGGGRGSSSTTSNNNSNDACFSSLGALQQTPPHSSSMDNLAMSSADGSLCIMEAFSRSQQPKDSWHALSRPMQTDSHCVQSQHYQLGGGGGDQHQQLSAQFELKQERDGPKLEDFLGGASLGGQYHSARTDSAHHDLDMYLAGASSAFDNNSGRPGDSSSSRINVNVPYSGMRAAAHAAAAEQHHHHQQQQQQQQLSSYGYHHHGGLGTTGSDVGSSSMATMASLNSYDSGSSSRHQVVNGDHGLQQHQQDNGNPAGALCTLQNALQQSHHGHGQHHQLLHAPLDHHTNAGGAAGMSDSLLADCSLQLPGNGGSGGSNMGPAGISAIKTWLRHHQVAASEKAGPLGAAGLGGAGGHHPLQQQSSKNAMSTLQSLSLSMSPGSQASSVLTASLGGSAAGAGTTSGSLSTPSSPQRAVPEPRKRGAVRAAGKEPSPRKSIDTFGQRTSVYRGVTRHRWTGRYEAHLWDNSCRKEGQTRKGRQVYLGGYDKEEKAARAYDLAALKYWGPTTTINFPLSTYEKELEEMKNMTRQEYVASLRRKSSGFSRGASVYRGVTRHHQHGRWQARIGRVAGNKDLYLGTYSTQEEAAEAYDIAAIKFRGINAVTNFDISRYDTKRICSGAVTIGQLTSKAAMHNKEAAAAAAAGSSIEQVPQQPALDQGQHQHQHQQQQHSVEEERQHSMLSVENSSNQQSSVMKNLQQWQMLYQQQTQAHRNSWMDQQQQQQQQQQAEHEQAQAQAAAAAFSDSLAMQQHKYLQSTAGLGTELQHPGMQNAVLRNLMGLDALPTDANDGSCSNGFLSSASNPLMGASTAGGAYSSATGDSPRNSSAVSEGEEGTSNRSAAAAAYDNVLQGDLSRSISMYMSQSPVKSSYDPTGMASWTTNGAVQNLQQVRPSMGGHGGIPPIFAVWNE